jgi:hypothetical protein
MDADGFVRVQRVVAPSDVAILRDRMWERLATHGLLRDDAATWSPGGGLELVALGGALRPGPGTEERLWAIGRDPVFAPFISAVGRAVDGVLGAGVFGPMANEPGGLAAPNFPIPGVPWEVPHAAWHMDEPMAASGARQWGLLAFAFLDDVEPGGGATVVIAGSHRRIGQLAAEVGAPTGLVTTDEALAALAREAWFAELFRPGDPEERRRFLVDHRSNGVPVRVVELTGRAGDVVLMDPRCLHTISANVSARPRLTLRLTFGRLG